MSDTNTRHTLTTGAARQADRLPEAIITCQDAADIFRETGDEHSERIALDDLNAAKAAADLCGRAHLTSVNNSYTWLVLRVRGCSRLGTIAQGRPPKAAPP
jgi:hypothetical protein